MPMISGRSDYDFGSLQLTTSTNGWQGAQLRWFDSVVGVLCEHLGAEKPHKTNAVYKLESLFE